MQILILAAGASTRMCGRDKLMENVGGQPLIAHVAGVALATGLPVTVTLPPDRPQRTGALTGVNLRCVTLPRPGLGMADSLKAGLDHLPPDQPVLLMLADMPDLTTADLLTVAQADQTMIQRGAAQDGTAGHPVLLPVWLLPELRNLAGDAGAKSLFQRHKDRIRLVPLPGRRAITDLDTPADWADWRALRPE